MDYGERKLKFCVLQFSPGLRASAREYYWRAIEPLERLD